MLYSFAFIVLATLALIGSFRTWCVPVVYPRRSTLFGASSSEYRRMRLGTSRTWVPGRVAVQPSRRASDDDQIVCCGPGHERHSPSAGVTLTRWDRSWHSVAGPQHDPVGDGTGFHHEAKRIGSAAHRCWRQPNAPDRPRS